jgi:hypothetical protein
MYKQSRARVKHIFPHSARVLEQLRAKRRAGRNLPADGEFDRAMMRLACLFEMLFFELSSWKELP